jgi:hypothetical protein
MIYEMCIGCHGAKGSGGLMMSDKMSAYENLVDASGQHCNGMSRIEPGDPEKSLMFLAISRTSTSGCKPPAMPPGNIPLQPEQVELVRAWIEDGAQYN